MLGHPRSTRRYGRSPVDDEKAPTEDIVELLSGFGSTALDGPLVHSILMGA